MWNASSEHRRVRDTSVKPEMLSVPLLETTYFILTHIPPIYVYLTCGLFIRVTCNYWPQSSGVTILCLVQQVDSKLACVISLVFSFTACIILYIYKYNFCPYGRLFQVTSFLSQLMTSNYTHTYNTLFIYLFSLHDFSTFKNSICPCTRVCVYVTAAGSTTPRNILHGTYTCLNTTVCI